MQRLFYALLLPIIAAGVSGPLSAAEYTLLLPEQTDVPFVEYRLEIGQIGDADNVQWLRVYPDGRSLAHYPVFMQRAGTYEFRMTTDEVIELAAYLIDQGMLEVDSAEIRLQQRALEQEIARQNSEAIQSGEVLAEEAGALLPRRIYDAPTTTIIVNLDVAEDAPPGTKAETGPVLEKRISSYALSQQAEWYPEIEELGRLAEVEARLRELFERPDLQPVD